MKRTLFASLGMLLLLSALFFQPMKANITVAAQEIDYDAKSYCLMDSGTGKILLSSKETETHEIASMVKLMTSLLTMEKLEKGEWTLDTRLMTSEYAASMYGSQAFLDAGYDYSVDELLKSVVIASANDSSVALAEGYAGTEDNFVGVMNKRAKELGLEHTVYANSTGLPASGQYSTAEDVATLLKEVAKHDLYHKYSTIWMDKLIHKSGRETELVNTNRLVRYFPGCDCGKTGFTDEAGYCLSASAKRNNMRLIAVVLGAKSSEDRFTATASLLNYGFSNFENKQYVVKDEPIKASYKVKGVSAEVCGKSSKDFYILSKRGEEKKDVIVTVEYAKKLHTPIAKDSVIGKIYLVENGIVVDEADVLSVDNYRAMTYGEIIQKVAGEWRF